MNKVKEEILQQLREVKQTARVDLQEKSGYENYKVKNVKYYGKVELVNKITGEKESFDLHVIEAADKSGGDIESIYYLNGQEIDFAELLRIYESPEPIKDVVDKAEENRQKPEKEQDKELEIQDLNELEDEKEKEDGTTSSAKEDEEENSKNDLTGKKPRYILQTIDVDKAYVDNWTTFRRGFRIPADVEKIAIAYPMQKDDHILSSTMTVYMLDNRGRILENVNGRTIRDFLEVDDATGHNPMYDDNTKLELDEYAEKNKGQTMRRFKSTQNPDLYLSAEQKKTGGYVEVYAGKRTRNGNDPVEVQLETDNVGIQTSLEMQEIMSGRKGVYQKENIDKEADMHEAHGDDEMKIAKENADGNRVTRVECDSPFIPGTDITWEELSETTGEGIKKLQERFEREAKKEKDPNKIIKTIEEDYEMAGHEHQHRF